MKRISIRVYPNSRINKIEEESDVLKVRITAPAVDGKANKAVIKLLAEHFNVRKTSITIIKGESTRNKIIEID